MDINGFVQKILKWLSEPQAREVVKIVVYLIFPIFVYAALRNTTRDRTAEHENVALKPRHRPPTIENILSPESIQETMAREKKKIETDLRETLGRQENLAARVKKSVSRSATTRKTPYKSPTSDEAEESEDNLSSLFSRRRT